MSDTFLVHKAGVFVVLLLSLTVHEWAHAISARMLGDDTAERMGRLTLNPVSHIDPLGTLIAPLFMNFGWAKPVPINPSRFSRKISMAWGNVIATSAGPVSNLVLALLCTLAIRFSLMFAPEVFLSEGALRFLLGTGLQINVLLAVFNLLPVPPLDGGRIVDALMPYKWRPAWETYAQYSPAVLLAIIILPHVPGFAILGAPLYWAIGTVQTPLLMLAGVR